MKRTNQITPAEFQIIEILWSSRERLSVGQVQARLSHSRRLAYTTVMTVLDKMAQKQSVERVKRGKAYFYRPRVTREAVLERLVRDFAQDYFRGSQQELKAFLGGDVAESPVVASRSTGELRVELL